MRRYGWFLQRYDLKFTIKLTDEFIKNKELDPRKYAKIRDCLCDWMKETKYNVYQYPSLSKQLKKEYAQLSTALNKLDEYYLDTINYIDLYYERNGIHWRNKNDKKYRD